jgi:hypothetical protein
MPFLQALARVLTLPKFAAAPGIPKSVAVTLAKVRCRLRLLGLSAEMVACAQRLAQCVNPRLPDGVHLKTLEVYSMVLRRLHAVQLTEDLPLYSAGLFPLFQYASTRVKVRTSRWCPAVLRLLRSPSSSSCWRNTIFPSVPSCDLA